MKKEINELGKKSSLVFIGDIIQKVVESISALLIGRLLGADVYGQFVFASSVLFFLAILPKMGMPNGVVNFLARDTISKKTKKSVLTFSLTLCVAIGLVLVALIYLNMGTFQRIVLKNEQYYKIFSLMLPSLVIITSRDIMQSYFLANRRIKEIIIINNFFVPISRIVFIVALYYGFGLSSYLSLVIPYYFNAILSVIVFFTIILKEKSIGHLFNKEFKKKPYFKYTYPLLLSGIINTLTENTDKYMLGLLISTQSVGVYRIAYLFGALSSFGLAAINKIFRPMIANLFYNNRLDELKGIYRFTAKWSFIISALVLGVIAINSSEIMRLPGDEFMTGSTALIVIAIGQLVNSAVGSVGLMNLMTGNSKVQLYSNVTATIVNVGLNLLLIPIYGMVGAAIATAASLIMNNMINFIFMYRSFKVIPFDFSFIKIGVYLIIIIFVFNYIFGLFEMNYILKLIISTLAFVGLFGYSVYRFGLTKEELSLVMGIFKGSDQDQVETNKDA